MAKRWNTASPLRTDSTSRALVTIQERSRPNPDRPKLRDPQLEAELERLDRGSAACYADLELITHKLHKLARVVDEAPEAGAPKDDSCGVPEAAIESESSLVQHIEILRLRAAEKDED